jgi:hypothetical protein
MLRLVLFLLPVALTTISAAQAVLPPGYEGIVDITDDTVADNLWPSINNRGQIVWSRRSDPPFDSTAEIFLYDNGTVTQLTDDDVRDACPDINDAGVIVWSRGIGRGETLEIVRYEDGTLTRLTDDNYSDCAPRINNNGWVAWYKRIGGGCHGSDSDIYLWDGSSAMRITHGGYQQAMPDINDSGDVVWTRYNLCHSPWTGTIMLHTAGATYALTADDRQIQGAAINNQGLIVWHGPPELWAPVDYVYCHRDGVTEVLTEWGSLAYLNDRGELALDRWHDDSQTWQVWLYRQGQFYPITADPFWNVCGDFDDSGNVVFSSGDGFTMTTNIRLLRRLEHGDLNCDGAVNAFDIDPFVAALVDPTEYQAQYADCDATLADLNLDGCVDVFDIDPFVDVLTR